MQNKLAVPVHAKQLVLRQAAKVSTTYSEHIKMQQIQSQTMSHDIQYSCTHTYKRKKKSMAGKRPRLRLYIPIDGFKFYISCMFVCLTLGLSAN